MKQQEEVIEKISVELATTILKAAAKYCKSSVNEVRGKSRRRFVVEARQLVTGTLKKSGWGYQEIADFLTYDKKGNHTNAMHWHKMHKDNVRMYSYYRNNYLQLQSVHADNAEEFEHYNGDLISVDMYNSLENRYHILKQKHESTVAELSLVRQSANKLKNQILKLC